MSSPAADFIETNDFGEQQRSYDIAVTVVEKFNAMLCSILVRELGREAFNLVSNVRCWCGLDCTSDICERELCPQTDVTKKIEDINF